MHAASLTRRITPARIAPAPVRISPARIALARSPAEIASAQMLLSSPLLFLCVLPVRVGSDGPRLGCVHGRLPVLLAVRGAVLSGRAGQRRSMRQLLRLGDEAAPSFVCAYLREQNWSGSTHNPRASSHSDAESTRPLLLRRPDTPVRCFCCFRVQLRQGVLLGLLHLRRHLRASLRHARAIARTHLIVVHSLPLLLLHRMRFTCGIVGSHAWSQHLLVELLS